VDQAKFLLKKLLSATEQAERKIKRRPRGIATKIQIRNRQKLLQKVRGQMKGQLSQLDEEQTEFAKLQDPEIAAETPIETPVEAPKVEKRRESKETEFDLDSFRNAVSMCSV
jgi:hypothetical protein